MKIKIDNVEFSYNGLPVLKDITANIEKGDCIALVGPNGSGKSTLVKCMNRILKPRRGAILIDERHIDLFPSQQLAQQMAYVPQKENRTMSVNVFDMVLTGRKPYINWKPREDDLEVVANVLRMLHIEHIAMKEINKLSGGQQQMVCIARALAQEPDILLLDEPTANLDIRHQLEIMDILRGLSRTGISTVIAMHDINMAIRYANKFIMLKEGQLFAMGGKEVITAENIEKLFQIKVHVIRDRDMFFIVPGVMQNTLSE